MHGVNKLSFNHIKRDKHNLLHKIHSSPFSFFDVDHNTLEVFTQFLRRPKYLHRYLMVHYVRSGLHQTPPAVLNLNPVLIEREEGEFQGDSGHKIKAEESTRY